MLYAITTDEELLNLVKDWREDEGWREFYARYAPAILAHARSCGLTRDQAEDVVQTTMLKLATYLPKFDYDRTVGRFRSWLNQVVNQRIIAIWHENRRQKLPESAWVHLREFVAGVVNPAADPVAQAEIEQRMLEVCLARAKNGVSTRHWQIFEANALLGMSAAEVASHYNTSAANVWVVHHRMIRRLRTEWKALLNEPF